MAQPKPYYQKGKGIAVWVNPNSSPDERRLQALKQVEEVLKSTHKRIFDAPEPTILEGFFKLLLLFEVDLRNGVQVLLNSRGVDGDSDLIDFIDVNFQQDLFQLLAVDYYQFVSKGRKPKARKVPVVDLIEWIKKKGIPYTGSINATAFAIQQSIYKKGIAGKNYEEAIIDFMIETISEFTSLYLQDTSITNIIAEFYRFKNNQFVGIGVDYKEIKKSGLLL